MPLTRATFFQGALAKTFLYSQTQTHPYLPEPVNMFILITEDDGVIALHVTMIISEIGYSVVGPFATQAQAITEVHANDQIVLAVLDHRLRDGPALALADLLRIRRIPYLWCTAQASVFLDDTAPVLEKPYSTDELKHTVRAMLEQPSG